MKENWIILRRVWKTQLDGWGKRKNSVKLGNNGENPVNPIRGNDRKKKINLDTKKVGLVTLRKLI